MLNTSQLVPNQGFAGYLLSDVAPGAFFLASLPRQVTSVTPDRCAVVVTYHPSPVKHLPLAWILGQKDRNCTLAGVMARLSDLEKREVNPHLKADYRQAWITLSFLQKGNTNAFVQASYVIYGCHPDFVWPNTVADRKARLGDEYFTWYTSDDILRPDIPQLPPRNADTHAANEASSATWDGLAGLVPTERKVI